MFTSRVDAGRQLGQRLRKLSLKSPVVLGITRGGVVAAAEVAKILGAPLYPLVIKKVSSPFNPEFAVGAVGPEGVFVGEFSQVAQKQVKEKMKEYGIKSLGRVIKNKIVVIVDDGVATGWTVKAGVQYAKSKKAGRIIVAVPVADFEIARQLGREVDGLLVLEKVGGLGAVGNYYEDFSQVTDRQVIGLIDKQPKR